jgi:hypothetical protein
VVVVPVKFLGVQRSGWGRLDIDDQSLTGGAWSWDAGAGDQDRTHVSRAKPAERHRAAQGLDQRVLNVGRTQAQQHVEFRGQSVVTDGDGTDEEVLGFLSVVAELFLDHYIWPGCRRLRARRVCDGFILAPHLTPQGLAEFVDNVNPESLEGDKIRLCRASSFEGIQKDYPD